MFQLPKFMGGREGSPMSRMTDQQKLQALGMAFGGDQAGLAQLMGGLPEATQRQGPVLNQDGEDISAAFSGVEPSGGGMGMPMGLGGMLMQDGGKALMSGAFGLGGMLAGRGFGFGKKKDR